MPPVQPSPALLNAQLTATVVELEEKLEEATRLNTRARTLAHENAALVDRVAQLEGTVSDLRAHLERLLKGSGAVAKIAPGQHVLFEDVTASIEALAAPEDLEAEAGAAELAPEDAEVPDGEAADDKQPKASNRPRDRRKIDESNLRREVVRVELPTAERRCPVTGVELEEVGVKVSTELGYKSAELVLIERHQVVYGPPPEVAEERQIEPRVTPRAPRAVEGVEADPSLLAWILHQKYLLHLPLYRQEAAFAQLGVRLSRKTPSRPGFRATG
jgi:transposase